MTSIPAGSCKPPAADVANSAPAGASFYALLPDYRTMVLALEKKRLELDVSYAALAEAASLQPGFVSGAMGGSETRKFGWLSLFLLSARLGLRVVFLDDPEFLARYEALPKRNANQARPGHYASLLSIRVKTRVLRHMQENGRRKRWRGTTKKQRRAHAQKMALARWYPD